jgi:hypothetical protein
VFDLLCTILTSVSDTGVSLVLDKVSKVATVANLLKLLIKLA